MDHCCPLKFEWGFNQIVVSIKKLACIIPIIISLTSVVVGSNLTMMIFANPITFKIIVPSFVGNSTSLKVENPRLDSFAHGLSLTSLVSLVGTFYEKKSVYFPSTMGLKMLET